jgi:hypothetical protein
VRLAGAESREKGSARQAGYAVPWHWAGAFDYANPNPKDLSRARNPGEIPGDSGSVNAPWALFDGGKNEGGMRPKPPPRKRR